MEGAAELLSGSLRLPRLPRLSRDTILPSSAVQASKSWSFWPGSSLSLADGDDNARAPPPPRSWAAEPAPLPLPPPPRPVSVVALRKSRRAILGIRFYSEPGDSGAEVQTVEEYGLAWRHGLAWGDVIERVRVYSARRPKEVRAHTRTMPLSLSALLPLPLTSACSARVLSLSPSTSYPTVTTRRRRYGLRAVSSSSTCAGAGGRRQISPPPACRRYGEDRSSGCMCVELTLPRPSSALTCAGCSHGVRWRRAGGRRRRMLAMPQSAYRRCGAVTCLRWWRMSACWPLAICSKRCGPGWRRGDATREERLVVARRGRPPHVSAADR